MVADIHPMATVGAVTIEDVKLPESEVGILWPEMRHDVGLDGVGSVANWAEISFGGLTV
jgi:hypothetical protein